MQKGRRDLAFSRSVTPSGTGSDEAAASAASLASSSALNLTVSAAMKLEAMNRVQLRQQDRCLVSDDRRTYQPGTMATTGDRSYN